LLNPDWKPDFGPVEFIPNWGATIVGARKFLIAYNVNLLSTKEQAHRIALDIREQGRGPEQVYRTPVTYPAGGLGERGSAPPIEYFEFF